VPEALRIGAYFGIFELSLPVVGWALGAAFAGTIEAVDHWIAFAVLFLVGARMAWNAAAGAGEEGKEDGQVRHSPLALMLAAVATSIDATAVGGTLHFMAVDVATTILLIGAVTFVMASGGVMIGRVAGARLGRWAEVAGGLGLIAIGTKILAEHTLGA
jgi:putative Mn2+ efflux pump MntP